MVFSDPKRSTETIVQTIGRQSGQSDRGFWKFESALSTKPAVAKHEGAPLTAGQNSEDTSAIAAARLFKISIWTA